MSDLMYEQTRLSLFCSYHAQRAWLALKYFVSMFFQFVWQFALSLMAFMVLIVITPFTIIAEISGMIWRLLVLKARQNE